MKSILIIGAAALLGTSMASADTILEYRTEGSGNAHTTMKVSDQRVLVKDHTEGSSMLYEETGSRMFVINDRKREYATLDAAAMQRMSDKIDQAMAQFEKQMENVPPAQREQMKAMMDGMMSKGMNEMTPEITRTGRNAEYNGISCSFVRMKIGDISESEMCQASIESLDLPADDQKTLVEMHLHMKKISDMMTEKLGMHIPFNMLEGIPIFIRDEDTPNGRVLHIDESATISGSELNVPENYREVPLEGMGTDFGG